MNIDPFGARFDRDINALTIHSEFEKYEGKNVKIAGRIMSKRRHGKADLLLTGSVRNSSAVFPPGRLRGRKV